MNLGCVVLPCPFTPVLAVIDGITENETEKLSPHMCAGCVNVLL